jgi:hypothetical protein
VTVAGVGEGAVYLDGSVGRWDWAQVRITAFRRGGRTFTRWTCVTALGESRGVADGTSAHVAVANFLPSPAVVAGASTLSFRVLHYGTLAIRRASVGGASGLEYTTVGPAHLVATLTAPAHARVGTTTTARLRVANLGDRAVRAIHVEWTAPPNLVRIAGARGAFDVAPHAARTREYRLRLVHAGAATLYVSAIGAGGAAVAQTLLRIAP